MMTTFRVLGLAGAILVCGAVTAAGQPAPATQPRVGVAFRSLVPFPVGFDVAVALNPKLNFRTGLNFFRLSPEFDDDGTTVAATVRLSGFDTHLDWYPGGGSFHVSPGVLLYNNIGGDLNLTVTPGDSFDLGDSELFSNPANPVKARGSVGFDRVAPSVTVGWGNVLPRGSRRWSVPFELGIIYTRSPTAQLAFSGSACAKSGSAFVNCRNVETDPTLQNEVKKEVSNLNEDISVLKFIPVISLGFAFRL